MILISQDNQNYKSPTPQFKTRATTLSTWAASEFSHMLNKQETNQPIIHKKITISAQPRPSDVCNLPTKEFTKSAQ